jgi:hypothetical protein
MSEYQLFYHKLGLYEPDNKNKEYIFALGHETEEEARFAFSKLTGRTPIAICAESEEYPYLSASLDGYDEKYGIFEAKLVGKKVLDKIIKEDLIPDHHWDQIQFQLLVTGLGKTQYFARTKDGESVLKTYERDENHILRLLALALGFQNRVKNLIEPELSNKDYMIPRDEKIQEAFKRLKVLKSEQDLIKAEIDSLKSLISKNAKHDKLAFEDMIFYKSKRKGSVKYREIPELKEVDLEEFRGESVEVWTLKYGKGA